MVAATVVDGAQIRINQGVVAMGGDAWIQLVGFSVWHGGVAACMGNLCHCRRIEDDQISVGIDAELIGP